MRVGEGGLWSATSSVLALQGASGCRVARQTAHLHAPSPPVQVPLAPDCVGPEVQALIKGLQPGQVLLLENVRWHPEEEKNDAAFAKQLAEASGGGLVGRAV